MAPKTFKKTLREAGLTFKWLIGCTHDDQLTHVHFGPDMRGTNSATMKLVSPAQVMAAFSQEPIVSDWLSPHTVKWGLGPLGPLEMLYFKPTRMRFIGLRDAIFKDIAGAEFVNDRVIFEVPMPGLLWVGSGKDYKIYATSSKAFHARMPLFKTLCQ
ncbi:MAG: hypothetical protein HC853_14645, partial [Anaerolineae bacterium]|nr:hypothetical protein [Anaerolineae bacterium]